MTRLDEIRARLAAATPGPWHSVWDDDADGDAYSTPTIYTTAEGVPEDDRGVVCCMYYDGDLVGATEPNAALIASAPDDLAFLLAEVERLTGEAAAERRKVGRELDTLARGLADADPTGRLGGALVASALSDIGSRLMAGMPVEDATVITVEVTP